MLPLIYSNWAVISTKYKHDLKKTIVIIILFKNSWEIFIGKSEFRIPIYDNKSWSYYIHNWL